MAEASPPPAPAPYVRPARRDELDALAVLARRAFIDDPVFNYSANLKEPLSNDVDNSKRRTLEACHCMLFKMAFGLKARVMVVAVPEASSEKETSRKTKERLAATCIWMPPGKRMGFEHPMILLRSGIFRVIRGWGVNGLMRLGLEYPDGIEKTWKSIWKEQKIKDDQGKGYLSLLVHEMFAKMPEEIIMLDASTSKSRDQYVHLGFRLEKPFMVGKGKANSVGYSEKGGPGMELYGMAKWGSLAHSPGQKDA
ncbi:hypothetical protein EWM64_g2279 [Hericium alpestre]|uniref:N-acetyltransferase domain-containing protein n=1 Tax=Hericium alpestre TaxID=135208 RepID=A0A4Z0A5X4_9AGAM|nr:hypothetical protein EWM64_g2279 [Hericium alpestre]